MAASAIWTVEPVPGLSDCRACARHFRQGEQSVPNITARGHGLPLLHERAWSVPLLHERVWSVPPLHERALSVPPLHQREWSVPHLHQRAWSVPDLSFRGRGLSLNSPAGVMSCNRPLC